MNTNLKLKQNFLFALLLYLSVFMRYAYASDSSSVYGNIAGIRIFTPISNQASINDKIITVPVAEGRYVIDVIDIYDVPDKQMQLQETVYKNGIITEFLFQDENGFYTEILHYQYLPLPKEFQFDTTIMTDEEYLLQFEKAVGYVGVSLRYSLSLSKKSLEHPMNAWRSGSYRWIISNDYDLFNEPLKGSYSAITLHDGALHLIQTADYRYASQTFRLNDTSILSAVPNTDLLDKFVTAAEDGYHIAIVATRFCPLMMRSGPSGESSRIMPIPSGDTIAIIEEGDWAFVEYNNQRGYVNSKYLEYKEVSK